MISHCIEKACSDKDLSLFVIVKLHSHLYNRMDTVKLLICQEAFWINAKW